ncbi:MAG: DUF4190 domain-containing protein [Microbacterium sp.]|uniref:DUF4190 domain-containing protein n=1 Tax=Microbacterium sp. TaxID=51671 RepID=UPI001AC99E4F|nr:DUF4190 domain-containing protein [Microbacterium sp.]MBN9177557.1 DUF4190 domain-containing protein [Microbacterium sp.]
MTDTTSAPRTNTLALVGFIAAFVIPVAGLVIGIVARNQLSRPGNLEGGRGFARWAMIIGAAGTVFQLAFFAVWLSLFVTAITNAPH